MVEPIQGDRSGIVNLSVYEHLIDDPVEIGIEMAMSKARQIFSSMTLEACFRVSYTITSKLRNIGGQKESSK